MPVGSLGQRDRSVVDGGIGRGHDELVGREHVVRGLVVQRRVGRGDAELLGGQHVVGILGAGWGACRPCTDDPKSGRARRGPLIISVSATEIYSRLGPPGGILCLSLVSTY